MKIDRDFVKEKERYLKAKEEAAQKKKWVIFLMN